MYKPGTFRRDIERLLVLMRIEPDSFLGVFLLVTIYSCVFFSLLFAAGFTVVTLLEGKPGEIQAMLPWNWDAKDALQLPLIGLFLGSALGLNAALHRK